MASLCVCCVAWYVCGVRGLNVEKVLIKSVRKYFELYITHNQKIKVFTYSISLSLLYTQPQPTHLTVISTNNMSRLKK